MLSSNTLGWLLREGLRAALVKELRLHGLKASAQPSLAAFYKGAEVGEYFADILVEGWLVIELKCVERLNKEHLAQCINYLRAYG
jgi:GxxExxY protein